MPDAVQPSTHEQVGVVGSREFSDLALVVEEVKELGDALVLSGGARGVDRIAEATAKRFRSYRPFKDEWGDWHIRVVDTLEDRTWTMRTFSGFAQAAHFRNDHIIRHADRLLIFWDGQSPGTKSIIDKVRKAGKDYTLFTTHEPVGLPSGR